MKNPQTKQTKQVPGFEKQVPNYKGIRMNQSVLGEYKALQPS